MAILASEEEEYKIAAKGYLDLEKKVEEFEAKGKTFHYDPYGPGIVPQEIYDSLKEVE